MISPRVAPPMIGLGLLEAIPEKTIRAGADPEDADGDGISGRVNTVWDFDKNQAAMGRYGWKAGQPSVRQQTTAASGTEWRTPPLWGIGLAKTVSPEATFLHDGRARNLLEAILWHGGEAALARERLQQMSKAEREALLAFLNSL